MADVSDRDGKEEELARKLARLFRKELNQIMDLLGDPPDLANIPADFWEQQGVDFSQEIRPFIEGIFLEQAGAILEEVPVGVDWTLVNERAAAWASTYTFDLVRELNDTSRQRLQDAVSRYYRDGLTIGELEQQLTGTFGPVRAEMIAVTEVTRAAARGEDALVNQLRQEGIEMVTTWNTNVDELVCFPKWTIVLTKRGNIPIQNVIPGDDVRTRKGWRKVVATSKRQYTGKMRQIFVDKNWLTATENHPVHHSKKGWLDIGKLQAGDLIDTIHNKPSQVSRIFDFVIGDPDNVPPSKAQVLRLSGVPLDVSMPVFSVNLDGDTQTWYKEINGIAPHSSFLRKFNFQSIKSVARGLFNACFPLRFMVAGQRAELPIQIPRANTNSFTASFAVDEHRGAATFFGTKVPIEPFFRNECFSTPFTDGVLGFGKPTSATTNGVTIRNRRANLKGFSTLWADLRNHLGRDSLFPARARAVFTTCFNEIWSKVKFTPALSALNVLTNSLSDRGSKLHFIVSYRHVAQLLTNIEVLYHEWCAKPIDVYDLQVNGSHEFYANGVLVHNCHICGPLNGKEAAGRDAVGEPYWIHPDSGAEVRIPAHPRCRCWEDNALPEV